MFGHVNSSEIFIDPLPPPPDKINLIFRGFFLLLLFLREILINLTSKQSPSVSDTVKSKLTTAYVIYDL